MIYTISKETGAAVLRARLNQARTAREQATRQIDALPAMAPDYVTKGEARRIRSEFAPLTRSGFVRLQFVNGRTVETGMPVRIFAEWLKLAPSKEVGVSFVPGAVILQAVRSSIRLATRSTVPPVGNSYTARMGKPLPLESLGAPIRLVAPADGGEFKIENTAPADSRPVAVVSPEVADAFGMRGMPDVIISGEAGQL